MLAHLRGADLLILNKTDLVGVTELAAVRTWLARLAPTAPIVETDHGKVPAPILLGPRHEGRGDADPASSHMPYESWSFTSTTPLERADVEDFVSELPAEVLRVKGFVHLADDPDHLYLLQVVGRRASLAAHRDIHGDDVETRLMLIGLPGSIDARRFQELLYGKAEPRCGPPAP